MTHEMYAEPGEVVEYFFGADVSQEPSAAVVIRRAMGTKLELGRLDPALSDMHLIDGAPNVGDKSAKEAERVEAGGWRHSKRTLAMREMMFEMGLARWNGDKQTIEYGPFPNEVKQVPPAKKSA